MASDRVIVVSDLRADLIYDGLSGKFFDRLSHREIGHTNRISGYRIVKYKRRPYRAGRLAFFWMYGRWPVDTIDHVNGKRDDDRWINLREATFSQNSQNRPAHKDKSNKFKGAYFRPRMKTNPWQAAIYVRGKLVSLGHFKTAEEANAAYAAAAKQNFGEFARS